MHTAVCYALTPVTLSCRELTTQWFWIRDWWPLAPITDRVVLYKDNSTRTLLLIDSERHAVLPCALVIQCKELGETNWEHRMPCWPENLKFTWMTARAAASYIDKFEGSWCAYSRIYWIRISSTGNIVQYAPWGHEHLEVWFDHSRGLSPSILVKQNSAAVFNEHAPVEGAIESIKVVLIPMW